MIYILIPLIYFVIGTLIARSVYTSQSLSVDSSMSRDITRQLENMKHGSSCYRNPSSGYYNLSRGCDCSRESEWKALTAKKREIEGKVTNPYLVLTFWPALGFHRFITGGAAKALAKRPNYREIERLEELNGFKELQ